MSPGARTRERILDAALDLASRRGAGATSMRDLAQACDLNVAALYYHFPSKADLLKAVIEERHYDLMMALVEVPPPGSGTDRERLRDLLTVVSQGLSAEEPVWRLLLAESCHHNTDAQDVGAELVRRFEEVAATWLENFDDLRVPRPVAARLMADFVVAGIGRTAIGTAGGTEASSRAADLAAALTREPS